MSWRIMPCPDCRQMIWMVRRDDMTGEVQLLCQNCGAVVLSSYPVQIVNQSNNTPVPAPSGGPWRQP